MLREEGRGDPWETAAAHMPPPAASGAGPRRSPRFPPPGPHPWRRDEQSSGAAEGRDGGGGDGSGRRVAVSTTAATVEDSPSWSEESSSWALHLSPTSRTQAEEAAAAFQLQQIIGFAGHGGQGNVYLARWFPCSKFKRSLRTVARINSNVQEYIQGCTKLDITFRAEATFAHFARLDWPVHQPLHPCLPASCRC